MQEVIPIFFNRQKFDVPKGISYADFRTLIGIPPGRALYLKEGRKYVEVTESNFALKPGQHYIDMPDWIEGEAAGPLPPRLAEDVSILQEEYGTDNVQVEVTGDQNWVVILRGFPIVSGFKGQSGEGVLRIHIDKAYQAPINGIDLTLPNGEVVTQCFNCQNWDPLRHGILTYLCAVQKWMEGKVNG